LESFDGLNCGMCDYALISAAVMAEQGLKFIRTLNSQVQYVVANCLFKNIVSNFLIIVTYVDEHWSVLYCCNELGTENCTAVSN